MDLQKLNTTIKTPFPDTKGVKKNLRYANLLQNDYAGMVSESTAIFQYSYQVFLLHDFEEEIYHIIEKIAINEMMHLEQLGITIDRLGGNPMFVNSNGQYFSGGYVNYSTNLVQMLQNDIMGEHKAIANYQMRIKQIDCPKVQELLMRIIADEKIHIEILTQLKDWAMQRNKEKLV